MQGPVPSKPIARSYAGAGLLPTLSPEQPQTICRYTASQKYTVAQGVELSLRHMGRWTGAVAELLEPLYDVLRQYGALMPGKVHADDIPVPVQEPGSGKTRTARLRADVRDDRNAGFTDAPGGPVRVQSGPRKQIHPQNHLAGLQRCASGRCLRWLPGVRRIRQNNGSRVYGSCPQKFYDAHARAPTDITTEAQRYR